MPLTCCRTLRRASVSLLDAPPLVDGNAVAQKERNVVYAAALPVDNGQAVFALAAEHHVFHSIIAGMTETKLSRLCESNLTTLPDDLPDWNYTAIREIVI